MQRTRGTDYQRIATTVQFGLPDGLPTRPVKRWTVDKLAILAYYLPKFAELCNGKAKGWYFLDGFAGTGVNVVSGEAWYKGSALIGLSTSPSAQHALLIEMDKHSAQSLSARAGQFSGSSTIEVGDSNVLIPRLLPTVFTNRHLPAFCVLDPEGLELDWATIESVAKHRLSNYTPYEMLIYFSTPGVARVSGKVGAGHSEYRQTLRRLFGENNSGWMSIAEDHEAGRLSRGESSQRYLRLYMNQIRDLGYKHVIPRSVQSASGHLIYHLIMATNNDTGGNILDSASKVAFLNNLPLLRD